VAEEVGRGPLTVGPEGEGPNNVEKPTGVLVGKTETVNLWIETIPKGGGFKS